MKIHKFLPIAVLAILMSSIMSIWAPQVVYAKCYDPTGVPIPCPDKEKKKETPTDAPAATATFDPANAGIIPTDRGQNSPSSLPYIEFGLIIVVCFGGGALFLRRRFMTPGPPTSPGDGSDQGRESPTKSVRESPTTPGTDKMGAQPHMIDWGDASPNFQKADDLGMHNNDNLAANKFQKADDQGGLGHGSEQGFDTEMHK